MSNAKVQFGVYSVRDRASGRYGDPFLAVTKEVALRNTVFGLVNQPAMREFVKDFELYLLGVFDVLSGKFSAPADFPCLIDGDLSPAVERGFQAVEDYMKVNKDYYEAQQAAKSIAEPEVTSEPKQTTNGGDKDGC